MDRNAPTGADGDHDPRARAREILAGEPDPGVGDADVARLRAPYEAEQNPRTRRERWLRQHRTAEAADRATTPPDPASPLGVLLYPYRWYVLIVASIAVPVLVILAVSR